MPQPRKSDTDDDPFGRAPLRLKADIRQKQAVEWNIAYLRMRGAERALLWLRQCALQASIEAGWIEEPQTRILQETDPETKVTRTFYEFDGTAVDDMLPAEVAYYGELCDRYYNTLVAIPKN